MDKSTDYAPINKYGRLIFYGYILLSAITFILLEYFQWARDLFSTTTLLVEINGVWFSASIVIYGYYAFQKNKKRVELTGVKLNLTPQYLLVACFFFFFVKQVIDLILALELVEEATQFAVTNVAMVVEFGGFVAGVGSIFFSRKS